MVATNDTVPTTYMVPTIDTVPTTDTVPAAQQEDHKHRQFVEANSPGADEGGFGADSS